jgi:superfamily II RNA helicase
MRQENVGLATYKGYVLDDFQRQALAFIEQGRSVIVSAPTGVGKTLIADYLIEKAVAEGKRVIYTAPIKALSNQKYRQFKASLGEEQVGIITGDIVVNSNAPVLMMTTEIYRNMALTDPARAADIHYLIFDEIHFIDSDRGVAWEESIIFAPRHVRLLGLSATIGNLEQFTGWLSEVRQEPVALVVETHRTVPLIHRFYNFGTGIASLTEINKASRRGELRASDHRQLVHAIRKHYLPALCFSFSRRQCVDRAKELLREPSFLGREAVDRVQKTLKEYGDRYNLEDHASFTLLSRLLHKGIAFHHAGLLPVLKDLVEELFEQGLVKVLYCTETFAVGVNYPVKSVCFLEQRKFDGRSLRPLSAQEYMQMSGRAGRRGIDQRGYVFTLVANPDVVELTDYSKRAIEPIGSQYRLSCNSILNLMRRGMEEQVAIAYRSSFAQYLNHRERSRLEHELASCETRRVELLGYICMAEGQDNCPVQYRRMQSKLRGLQREWLRYRRRYLERKCRALEAQVSAVIPKNCPPVTQNRCRRAKRQLGKLQEEATFLAERLSALPTADDWLERYNRIKQRLGHLGYIDGNEILARGELASEINFQEILITEFVFAGMLDELTVAEICSVLVGIDYSARYSDFTSRQRLPFLRKFTRIADELRSDPILGPGILYSPQVAPLGYAWANGEEFSALMELTTIEEGDVVSLLRRLVDVIRQLRKALGGQPFWGPKLIGCLEAIERDAVKVEL